MSPIGSITDTYSFSDQSAGSTHRVKLEPISNEAVFQLKTRGHYKNRN